MKRIWALRLLLTFAVCLTICPPGFADGLDSWQQVSTSPYGAFTSIAYGNGAFAATSLNSHYPYMTDQGGISFSADGRNWTHLTNPNWPSGLVFGNGTFVVGAQVAWTFGDAGAAYYSTNGLTWTNSNFYGPGIRALTFGNGIFVTAGYGYENSTGDIETSTDGVNWTDQVSGTTNMLNGIAWGNGWFVTVGSPNTSLDLVTNGTVTRSSNGTNWVTLPAYFNPFAGVLGNLFFINGYFYVTESIYHTGNPNPTVTVYSSTDGLIWQKVTTPIPALVIPPTGSNSLYVTVGSGGAVSTSTDATNWISRNTGITNDLFCIAYGNNSFVSAGSGGAIFQSASTLPSLLGQKFPAGGFQITLTNGLGPSYRLEASTDLSGWTNLYTFTNIEVGNQFLDLSSTNFPSRFYRAVWP